MNISIAGNTSFTFYCAEKLCRRGFKVDRIFLPSKGAARVFDDVDFVNLSGEFDIELVNLPLTNKKKYQSDLVLNLEWPSNLELPVKTKYGSISSNLCGQFDKENLLDIAADIYNGKNKTEIQVLWEQTIANNGSVGIEHEPPFFKVLSSHPVEINHLDDLRSAKTKVITSFYKLLLSVLDYVERKHEIPQPSNRELAISKVKTEKLIDWNQGAIYLHNLVRSLTHPGPGAYTIYDDTSVKIWRGHYFELSPTGRENAEPGTILDIIEEVGLIVQTGHGTFLVTRVQASGAPELPAWVWADRDHINPGDKFHSAAPFPKTAVVKER